MKHSSILMSSFAALLILISAGENPLKSTDFLSKPDQTEINVPHMNMLNEASSATHALPVSNITNDVSYLKFNVSGFVTEETGYDEMPYEADPAFLKFKVSDYIETETEIGVLPEDSDVDYLKFEVNKYITNSYGGEELPSTDLDYLKFDVQKYVHHDSVVEIIELPEAENQ